MAVFAMKGDSGSFPSWINPNAMYLKNSVCTCCCDTPRCNNECPFTHATTTSDMKMTTAMTSASTFVTTGTPIIIEPSTSINTTIITTTVPITNVRILTTSNIITTLTTIAPKTTTITNNTPYPVSTSTYSTASSTTNPTNIMSSTTTTMATSTEISSTVRTTSGTKNTSMKTRTATISLTRVSTLISTTTSTTSTTRNSETSTTSLTTTGSGPSVRHTTIPTTVSTTTTKLSTTATKPRIDLPWNEWDKCSRFCGTGYQIREKLCPMDSSNQTVIPNCDPKKQVQVCNDFNCDVEICEDSYFDLILLVHQSDSGVKAISNWEKITKYIKKVVKGFKHENPGMETYRLAMVVYGQSVELLFNLNDFDGDRKALFDRMEKYSNQEKLIANTNMFKGSALPEALGLL